MKKILGFITCILLMISLVGCGLFVKTPDDGDQTPQEKHSYVSLDINPSVEFIVSEDGKVVKVYAKNDDAKILLVGEASLEGVDIKEAVKKITDLCIEYGYLTDENADVEISVTNSDVEEAKKLEDSVKQTVENETKNLGFAVSVTVGLTEEMLAKYDEFKAEMEENGLTEEVSIEKFKLIESAMSSDESLTVVVAVTLNEEELINRITSARDEMYNVATATYEKMLVEVENAYEQIRKSFERMVYSTYYLSKAGKLDIPFLTKHPVDYGALYAMYGAAADATEAVIDLQDDFENFLNESLTEEQINQIALELTKLNVTVEEVKEGIKDENGNVTLDSINAYLDTLLASVDNEALKAEIADIQTKMDELTSVIKEQTARLESEYYPQLEMMVAALEGAYKAAKPMFETIQALIPVEVKEQYKIYLDEVNALITTIKTTLSQEEVTLEDLEGWITSFRAKEQEFLNKINTEYSEEELAEIEALKEAPNQAIEEAKKKLDEVKNTAKSAVEEELQKLKEERKPKTE